MIVPRLFIYLLFLLCIVYCSQGCTCIQSHPQQQFCDADFVIRAVPLSVVEAKDQKYPKIYTVRIERTFKGNGKKGDVIELNTGANSALCGAFLDTEGQPEYLIAGDVTKGKRQISSCGWVELWDNVKPCIRQRLCKKYYYQYDFSLFDFYHMTSGLYEDNCQCQIKLCQGKKCKAPKSGCLLKSSTEQRNDICNHNMYRHTKRCSWEKCVSSSNLSFGDILNQLFKK